MMRRRAAQRLLVIVVALHLATALAHGGVHLLVPVPLAWWQSALVASSIVVGPVVGTLLALRDRARVAGAVLVASFAVALCFEVLAHFVVASPDHVGSVASHQLSFSVSAILGVLTDVAGIGIGIAYWYAAR